MDRALHTRRRVLLAGGAALTAGLAGCTDSSRTDQAPAEDNADDGGTDNGTDAEDGGDGGMDGGSDDGGGDDGDDSEGLSGAGEEDGELGEPPDEEGQGEGLGRGESEGEDEEQGSANATVTVAPGGTLEFDPPSVEVQQGETVRWEWDSADHTVTPDATPEDGQWEGEPESQDTNYVYEHTFETAGTYTYYCDVHPEDMTGRVVVHG